MSVVGVTVRLIYVRHRVVDGRSLLVISVADSVVLCDRFAMLMMCVLCVVVPVVVTVPQ